MILGIGTDLLLMSRIQGITDEEDPFLQRTFTRQELEQALGRERPREHLCTKFAIKEAAYKALNIRDSGVRLSMIEVLNDTNGRPVVVLHNVAREAAEAAGAAAIHASASLDGEYASAVVVVSGGNP